MFDIVKGFSTILFAALLDNLLYFSIFSIYSDYKFKKFCRKKDFKKN